MQAQRYDFPVDQGSDFELAITYTETDGSVINLTENNYVVRMTIREDVEDTTAASTLSSTTGNIILATTSPNIYITLPFSQTKDFTFDNAFYDIEVSREVAGSAITADKIMRGKIKLVREITR